MPAKSLGFYLAVVGGFFAGGAALAGTGVWVYKDSGWIQSAPATVTPTIFPPATTAAPPPTVPGAPPPVTFAPPLTPPTTSTPPGHVPTAPTTPVTPTGACQPACTKGQICTDGRCACPHPGDVLCAKGCTNPQSDNFACGCTAGGTGVVCKAGEECCGSRCVACAQGQTFDPSTCACKAGPAPPPSAPSAQPGQILCPGCMAKCNRGKYCTACCTTTPDWCSHVINLCGP